MTTPPTPAQRRVLRNLARGLKASHGLSGMPAIGGLHSTLMAMKRRGWLVYHEGQWVLSGVGREVAEQEAFR